MYGAFVRRCKTPTKPIDILPDFWQTLNVKRRQELIDEYPARFAKRLAEEAEAGDGDPAALASGNRELAVAAPDDYYFPRMPVTNEVQEHREKLEDSTFPFNIAVARTVNKRELASNNDARAAVQVEWDKLRRTKCWDKDNVRVWSEVAEEARRKGVTVHVGRIFEIVVEKGAELARGDPARKYKGRVVYQGNQVKDENYDNAIFADLSSAPSTIEAAKAVDAYGLFPGNGVEQSDAVQAYTQCKLGGVATYVRLPKEQQPKAWAKFRDPVCLLKKALYGHPDAGGYWEEYCDKHLKSVG